ncbi:transglutaminase domain-containing protein [Buchananella hordeovulneris]|uniref:transglutaminase-like domain-containing protein n=1 Tax=Buchananella hordeovulneris TaxID=52770 RepID=UPI000F5DF62B|nr:transglutaminase-like domain-containing protein [Buchananella hordeovulneris]RRD52412.1 transglutaminase domain-containing protein [Buchananella hordeovulneris]
MLLDRLILGLLFLPTVVVHAEVFGTGVRALLPAGSGLLLGSILAWLAHRFKFSALGIIAATGLVFFACGGVAAVPSTTVLGFVPTPATFVTLATQLVDGWMDLLTLTPPAGNFIGPAVVPYVSSLLLSLAAGLVLPVRHGRAWAVLPLAANYAVAIAFSTVTTRLGAPWAAAWMLGVLAWWAISHLQADRKLGASAAQAAELLAADPSPRRRPAWRLRTVVAATLTLAVAGAGSALAVGQLQPGNSRDVLRTAVAPPLELHEYPSPLASFFHLNRTLATSEILVVSGVAPGERIRFATMDSYDGIIASVSDRRDIGEGFRKVGSEFPAAQVPEGHPVAYQVHLSNYQLPWLPTIGATKSVEFAGEGETTYGRSLYADSNLYSALVASGGLNGATYRATGVAPRAWTDAQLKSLDVANVSLPPLTGVPVLVASLASEISSSEVTALGRARALEQYLRDKGFYAGPKTDPIPGHSADRISRMLSADQLVGDDEQYAVLMMLLARSVGLPARVVMGAYHSGSEQLAPGQPLVLHGSDVHVWVEIAFEGAGWVPFDPTPPTDQLPRSQSQSPKQIDKPQVLQPPPPPKSLVELAPEAADQDTDKSKQDEPALIDRTVLYVVGGFGLLLLPLALLAAAKAWRAWNRRRRAPRLALRGSFDEFVDQMVERGIEIPLRATRREVAQKLGTNEVRHLATLVDEGDYGPTVPNAYDVTAAWQAAREARRSLPVPWWRKALAPLSLAARKRQRFLQLDGRRDRRT